MYLEIHIYFRIENDLADITGTLCNSDEEFKKTFLKFFFSDIRIDDVTSIERGAGRNIKRLSCRYTD